MSSNPKIGKAADDVLDVLLSADTPVRAKVLLFNRKEDVLPLPTRSTKVKMENSSTYITSTSVEPVLEATFIGLEPLSGSSLHKKYQKEYNSWRNRKAEAKKKGIPFDPAFETFEGFLSIMGPKPNPDAQLDKINPSKGYVKDNCRWASPSQNSRNRDSTRFVTYKGETLPLSEWASRTGQSPSTLYARHAKGWSDSEVIEGRVKQSPPESVVDIRTLPYWEYTPWPTDKAVQWEELYQRRRLGDEHRLTFFVRYVKAWIEDINEQGRQLSVPEEFDDGDPEREAKLRDLTKQLSHWSGKLKYAAGLRESCRGFYRPKWYSVPDRIEAKLRELFRKIP